MKPIAVQQQQPTTTSTGNSVPTFGAKRTGIISPTSPSRPATTSNVLLQQAWSSMYTERPRVLSHSVERFDSAKGGRYNDTVDNDVVLSRDIEAIVRQRVQILAEIERLRNSNANLLAEVDTMLSVAKLDPTRDQVGHYLCRLAFSTSESLRMWFLRNEEVLFKARVRSFGSEDQAVLFNHNAIPAQEIKEMTPIMKVLTDTMRQRFAGRNKSHAKASAVGNINKPQALEAWYSVPFTLVPDAVRRRDVVCHRGRALLEHEHVVNMLYTQFHTTLTHSLGEAMQQRMNLLESTLFKDVVAMVDEIVTVEAVTNATKDADVAEGTVKPSDIEHLAMKHFPPCMQQLHEQLKRDKHLKFHGRWQYGTFLKRIGLSMEDSIEFFGAMDAMGIEKFRKSSYAYSIRHYYGKEGKHTSYSAMGCAAIINGAPPSSDSCHGCPYRHSGNDSDVRMLATKTAPNAPVGDIEDIVRSATSGHYTRACLQQFRAVRPQYHGETLFMSPFQFYEASLSLVKPLPGRVSEKKRTRLGEAEGGGQDMVMSMNAPSPTSKSVGPQNEKEASVDLDASASSPQK
eukprot:PhM_4_TR2600/c0_g1_i1/m.74127/K02685/PRI2; DNA primase large subunit